MTLPEEFTTYTRALMGEERFARFLGALDEPAPVSIRVNPFKAEATPETGADRVVWCRGGYYLDSRPAFTFDPLLHAGAYYVQEASSMFIDHVVRQFVHVPVTALDLCAARAARRRVCVPPCPRGEPSLQQRASSETGADPSRERREVWPPRSRRDQQLRHRLPARRPPLRPHPRRHALLRRGHVSQGPREHRRVEPGQRGEVCRAAAVHPCRHLALPAARRTADLLHLHLQRPRERGQHRLCRRGTGGPSRSPSPWRRRGGWQAR